MYKKCLLLVICLFSENIYCLQISRVILASNANRMYLDFWPFVAEAWRDIIGIRPTLALIADDSVIVDETIGDVIRFKPIDGIPTSFQAQVIRLLLPILFEDDGCIVSDIDLLPINREYLIKSCANSSENSFVVYRDEEYAGQKRFPMCFVAARGKTFGEVFHVNTVEDIKKAIIQWYALGLGWATDELVMYQYLVQWPEYARRCKRLGHKVTRRIDRLRWGYDINLVKKKWYIDAHMLRPYSKYKKEIDVLLQHLSLSQYNT